MHRVLFHEITKDAVKDAMAKPGKIDDRQGQRAAGAPHSRPPGGLQGEPDPLEEHQDRALGRPGADGGAAADRGAGARDPRLHAAGVLDHRGGVREGRPGLRGGAQQDRRAQAGAAPTRPRPARSSTRSAASCRSSSPRSRSSNAQEAPRRRRSPPARCSRKRPRSSGFSARRTMRAAQDLYEGMEVGEDGPVGLITYMRTDSVRVADTAIAAVRELHRRRSYRQGLPARDAERLHLRRRRGCRTPTRRSGPPTSRRRPEDVQKYLEPDQFKLYQLIWQRFVASQMTPAVYDMTTVDFDLGRYLFRATGSVHVFDGYQCSTPRGARRRRGRRSTTCRRSRRSRWATGWRSGQITPSQHFTEPPPRFSEASLVKELERLGIGRPVHLRARSSARSPRASTSKLEQRRFMPTRAGRDGREDHGGPVPRRSSTSSSPPQMEAELDKIEEGELGWQRGAGRFLGPVQQGARRRWTSSAIVARGARPLAGGAGEGALSQVRRHGRAAHRAVRARTSPASTTSRPATT